MNEETRFEAVLVELRELMAELAPIEPHIVLIGGQVIALEARSRGEDSEIHVDLPTGIRLSRGFSFEPDLLVDVDGAQQCSGTIVDVLRASGYLRTRDFAWRKTLAGGTAVDLDLFRPDDADPSNVPTSMTPVDATLALARPRRLRITLASNGGVLQLQVPDPAGFLAMKLDAKLRYRPDETKDSFDIIAYLTLLDVDVISESLDRAESRGLEIRQKLRQLFADVDSPGVRDVLAESPNLSGPARDLVAQSVIDLVARFNPYA